MGGGFDLSRSDPVLDEICLDGEGWGTCWPVLFLGQLSSRELVPKPPDMPKPPGQAWHAERLLHIPKMRGLTRFTIF